MGLYGGIVTYTELHVTESFELRHYPYLQRYFTQLQFAGGCPLHHSQWKVAYYKQPYVIYSIPSHSRYSVEKKRNVSVKRQNVLLRVPKKIPPVADFLQYHQEQIIYCTQGKLDLTDLLAKLERHKATYCV